MQKKSPLDLNNTKFSRSIKLRQSKGILAKKTPHDTNNDKNLLSRSLESSIVWINKSMAIRRYFGKEIHLFALEDSAGKTLPGEKLWRG